MLWEEGQPATPAGQSPLTAATFANYTRGSPLDAAFASSLRRAYYAAISLMDDSIGRTLAVLEELQLEQDTVIIFHADHGCVQTPALIIAALVQGLTCLLANGYRGPGRRQSVA